MAKKKTEKRRAVGYCRTSSESQRDNASIPDQKAVIKRACEANGWELLKFYVDEAKSGKSIDGRPKFKQLMRDAANGKFDVVVSLDVKRFGRDGMDILQSTDTLKRIYGVDYVEAKGGFETKSGSSNVVVNFVQAGVAEAERLLIKERTMPARRRKARETGAPTWGGRRSWPYGRLWNKTLKKWELDEEKKAIIVDAAHRYLAGESIKDIAIEYGMDPTSLYGILRDKCGETITVRFGADPEIDLAAEEVEIKVRPLLPKRTIQRIHKRLDANRTKPKGHRNTEYVLSGAIYCATCNRSLTPQTSNGIRYYRACGCDCFNGQVNAEQMENAVMRYMFEMFGNPAKMIEAIDAAIPNKKKVAQLQKKQARLAKELAQTNKKLKRLVDAITDGVISNDDARDKRQELDNTKANFQTELDTIATELESVPTQQSLKRIRGLPAKRYFANNPRAYEHMTHEEKRVLVEMVLADMMPDGRRSGVYVASIAKHENRRPRPWKFTLLGRLVDEEGRTDVEPDIGPPAHLQKELVSQLTHPSPAPSRSTDGPRKRGQVQFAGTALRVLRTNWT